MKKVLFVVLIGVFSLNACAKQSAPDAVTKAFQTKFPDAQRVKWEMEEDNKWEADFKANGEKLSACFDENGAWLKTEKEMKKSKLPSVVKSSLDEKFKDYDLEEVEALETPDFSGYAIELKIETDGAETELEVWATDSGEITVKSEATDGDEDEDEDEEEEDEEDGEEDEENEDN